MDHFEGDCLIAVGDEDMIKIHYHTNEPWKVLHRADCFLLAPHEIYECVGDVPNVVFPCAALTDAETGRIAVYYGAADTSVALAFTTVDETINFIKQNDLVK